MCAAGRRFAAGGRWAGAVAGSLLVCAAAAATPGPGNNRRAGHFQPDRFAGRAGQYYRLVWGVDELSVRWTESGQVLRFSYRVLDADKARGLNDERSEPSLIDPRAGISLVVPTMDKIGKLRQSNRVEAGKAYWVAFSNKGQAVKRGDRVDVRIGSFHANGLVVD